MRPGTHRHSGNLAVFQKKLGSRRSLVVGRFANRSHEEHTLQLRISISHLFGTTYQRSEAGSRAHRCHAVRPLSVACRGRVFQKTAKTLVETPHEVYFSFFTFFPHGSRFLGRIRDLRQPLTLRATFARRLPARCTGRQWTDFDRQKDHR